jgi:hypothetical protein
MKPVQIVLLVVAGALGGAILTKSWNKAHLKPPVQAVAQQQAAQTLPETPPVAEPTPVPAQTPAPAAAEPAEPAKPSQAPRSEAPKKRKVFRPAPPPANPRPVETARVEQISPLPIRPEPAPLPVESAPARSEPVYTPAPLPPPPHQVTLSPGMLISVRLIDGLTSERNASGDVFTGTLDHELVADGFVIAERGSRVEGRVVNVDPGGKVKGVATMSVELSRIHTADGQTVGLQTDAFERRAAPSHTADVAKVGAGAALGAIIGAIAGGGKGAAIGAGAGGAAGAGTVMMTRGKPVTIPSETRINFRLRSPVTITERK